METRISANQTNKTATVAGENYAADINKDYRLINLGNQTFKADARFFRALYLTFEIADQLGEKKE